ncbi:MAG: MFS transporter [Acetobacteraceae bacterium]|nr:MFS transporter [Acetobacteraceae bacterium]
MSTTATAPPRGGVLDDLSELERTTMRHVIGRFLPLLMIAYVSSFLDRVNAGFAALTANRDLGLSATAYGWGAGLFFVGYFLFEFPSNIILERVGARLWLARIMLTLGLLAAAMALVTGPLSFYTLRFLLGIAEAGFFPGVILFLTYWLPQRYRARCIGIFMLGVPVSSLVGSPISGLLLGLDGMLGFKGWQWLYMLEALPSIVLAGLCWWLLTDQPAKADWLAPAQREWLIATLAAERRQARQVHAREGYLRSLINRRVLYYAAIYFNVTAASYGLSLWLPQIVKSFGVSNVQTGLIAAIPFAFGSVAMLWWGRHSDRSGERLWHAAACAFTAAIGLGACMLTPSPTLQMVFISIAAVGIFGIKGPFLTLLANAFRGPGAAGGIAMATAIGNLSGFLPPFAMGWIRDATGSFSLGLLLLAVLAAMGGIHILFSAGFDDRQEALHHEPA